MSGPPPPPPPDNAPLITTTVLPQGALAVAYDATLTVLYGTHPFAFAVTAGALPPGLALNVNTGEISGTPTATGNFNFIITVTDWLGKTGGAAFNIAIPTQPSIQNSSLPGAVVGVAYFASLVGAGGAAPYGYQVTAGSLPQGLTLATTGGITGLPTQSGNFTITFQIYDSNDPQGVNSATFIIAVQPSSIQNPVMSIDQCFLMGAPDGGLYIVVPGQFHDEDYDGTPIGFLQRWQGVPGPSSKLQLQQLGGATVSAKGNGNLNVTAIDDNGVVTELSKANRVMALSMTETKRDFMAKGAAHSERFGIALDNGGVVDAWFEAHVAILWLRAFFGYRKG